MRIALVAIVKNEVKGIREWLAYHAQLGFDDIVLYDNISTDGTTEIIEGASAVAPISRVEWPNQEGLSPQVSAYEGFLEHRSEGYDWVAFFDADEFLVLRDGQSLHDVLQRAPEDAGAIGVNWVTFGSSGQQSAEYDSVLETFTLGPRRNALNNRHIKSIVKPKAVSRYHIHRGWLHRGWKYYYPNMEPFRFETDRSRGRSHRIEHSVMHLNHYQIKSREEFEAKISRGRAGVPVGNDRIRKNPELLVERMDRTDARFHDIDLSVLDGETAQLVFAS